MLGSQAPVIYGATAATFQVNYTGVLIDAVEGNRTAIAVDLPIGAVLVMDPFGPREGRGVDFSRARANFLTGRKVIVTAVPITARRGGFVECVSLADNVLARVLANCTAGTTHLIVAADQFHLVNSTAVAAIADFASYAGVANQTLDLSGGAGLLNIAFRPLY